jgi:hypothetical protein
MATAVVSEFLGVNSAGVVDALALEVYSGLVLGAYNKATVTAGRHIERNIASGKSAQFPATGRATTSFHTAGTELTFQQINSNAHVISIQNLMVSPIFIDILDEAKSHFEVRAEYASQQGSALAEAADARVLMAGVAGARTSTPPVTGLEAGGRATNAAMGTTASVLKAGVYDAAEAFDTNSIPADGRSLFLAPAQYYLLLQDGEFIDRDFNDGSNGNRSQAVMRNAADFEVVKTTNLPSTDESADLDVFPTRLELDYQAHIALAMHSGAVGSVTLIGLQFESEYDMNRQGNMLVAKYAKGFDYLRPEAAYELATA